MRIKGMAPIDGDMRKARQLFRLHLRRTEIVVSTLEKITGERDYPRQAKRKQVLPMGGERQRV